MQKSYTSNYIKIYFWQGVSLVLNFLSLFIVVPYLTSNPAIYGVYTVCISISIFLTYADLGFIGAGQKYAAEYFTRNEREEEMKVIGFVNFILLVFLVLFSLFFLFLSFYPELLLKDLISGNEKIVASELLLILSLSTPVIMIQRLLQMIFGIRLEDFIVQRTNVLANLLKILSVLWFFRNGEYDIVGYFLFVQIVNLMAALLSLLIAQKRYNYNFGELIRSIQFNKEVFNKTKSLAFTSLYLTFTWILYYELDPAIIGKLFGAGKVAIFAIGLTILSFFRTIFGMLFSPFNIRFNHFIGNNDEAGLKIFYFKIASNLAPLVILPILTLVLLARPLILSWVGENYEESVNISQLLMLCNLFAFITYPTSFLLMAKERIKELYLINTIIPIVYWIGIVSTYSIIGLKSFAIFKLLSFVFSIGFSFVIMLKYFKMSTMLLMKMILRPLLLPILFIIISSFFMVDFLPSTQSKFNLLIVLLFTILLILSSFLIVFFSSKSVRREIYIAIHHKKLI